MFKYGDLANFILKDVQHLERETSRAFPRRPRISTCFTRSSGTRTYLFSVESQYQLAS